MAYLVISSPFLHCLITIPFVLGGYFDIDHILDMVHLVISSPFLDCPIMIPFVLRGYFDIDLILEEVERVMQSQFRWLLEGQFSLTLYHLAMSNGGDFLNSG